MVVLPWMDFAIGRDCGEERETMRIVSSGFRGPTSPARQWADPAEPVHRECLPGAVGGADALDAAGGLGLHDRRGDRIGGRALDLEEFRRLPAEAPIVDMGGRVWCPGNLSIRRVGSMVPLPVDATKVAPCAAA